MIIFLGLPPVDVNSLLMDVSDAPYEPNRTG